MEACARAAEKSYRNDHANEVAAGGPDYDAVCWQARTARRRCAEDIRSLSPKGTTPATRAEDSDWRELFGLTDGKYTCATSGFKSRCDALRGRGTLMAWRVGRKVGRTIYDGDTLIGVMDTPELAAVVVEAVNRRAAPPVAPQESEGYAIAKPAVKMGDAELLLTAAKMMRPAEDGWTPDRCAAVASELERRAPFVSSAPTAAPGVPGDGPWCWHCKAKWPCGCQRGERILATLEGKYGPSPAPTPPSEPDAMPSLINQLMMGADAWMQLANQLLPGLTPAQGQAVYEERALRATQYRERAERIRYWTNVPLSDMGGPMVVSMLEIICGEVPAPPPGDRGGGE